MTYTNERHNVLKFLNELKNKNELLNEIGLKVDDVDYLINNLDEIFSVGRKEAQISQATLVGIIVVSSALSGIIIGQLTNKVIGKSVATSIGRDLSEIVSSTRLTSKLLKEKETRNLESRLKEVSSEKGLKSKILKDISSEFNVGDHLQTSPKEEVDFILKESQWDIPVFKQIGEFILKGSLLKVSGWSLVSFVSVISYLMFSLFFKLSRGLYFKKEFPLDLKKFEDYDTTKLMREKWNEYQNLSAKSNFLDYLILREKSPSEVLRKFRNEEEAINDSLPTKRQMLEEELNKLKSNTNSSLQQQNPQIELGISELQNKDLLKELAKVEREKSEKDFLKKVEEANLSHQEESPSSNNEGKESVLESKKDDSASDFLEKLEKTSEFVVTNLFPHRLREELTEYIEMSLKKNLKNFDEKDIRRVVGIYKEGWIWNLLGIAALGGTALYLIFGRGAGPTAEKIWWLGSNLLERFVDVLVPVLELGSGAIASIPFIFTTKLIEGFADGLKEAKLKVNSLDLMKNKLKDEIESMRKHDVIDISEPNLDILKIKAMDDLGKLEGEVKDKTMRRGLI